MLLGLLAGVGFALGHHLFYQSLQGKSIGNTLFDQQVNIAIGTAFAFLVKASLATAVGSAYVQYLWYTLQRERLRVSHIDSLVSLLTSVIAILNFGALKGHLLLTLLALLAWTIPFAAIVPPATLSVHAAPSQRSTTATQTIPMLDWNSNNYAQQYQASRSGSFFGDDGDTNINYNGPQSYFARLATATTIQGTIPALRAPSLNSSYTLSFLAPAISCEIADNALIDEFTGAFGCNPRGGNDSCTYFFFEYIAWTPSGNAVVPLATQTNSSITVAGPDSGMSMGSSLGNLDGGPATLFIAADSTAGSTSDWTVLNCSLWNSSYTVDFAFTNGEQRLSVQDVQHLNPVTSMGSLGTFTPICETSPDQCNGEPALVMNVNQDAINYQSVMDVFGKLLVGAIWIYASDSSDDVVNTVSTNVMSTNLVYTNELFTSFNSNSIGQGGAPLPAQTLTPLLNATEELFQNITLSLFSDGLFTPANATDVLVTIYTIENIYTYTWERLAISYGVAIALTLLAVITGFVLLLINGASYSNKFSTIMRATRGGHIDMLVMAQETSGADPLDEGLAKAKIWIGAQGGAGGVEEDREGLTSAG